MSAVWPDNVMTLGALLYNGLPAMHFVDKQPTISMAAMRPVLGTERTTRSVRVYPKKDTQRVFAASVSGSKYVSSGRSAATSDSEDAPEPR